MLPINFHKTFVPERRLIGSLLQYAALGKEGDYRQIAAETGIPTGESTGKVPAVLDYSRGMGLVDLAGAQPSSIKRPILTPFGRAVYTMDRNLGEAIVQWLAHMNLCRGDIGAVGWHSAFARGRRVLGSTFARRQLDDYLTREFGPGNDRIGPLIRTYLDDAALARAGVLSSNSDQISRRKAPLIDSYALPYSAFVLSLMEAFFPDRTQVTLDEFGEKTLWFDVCLWDQSDIERLLGIVERKGLVGIDRQMRPWLLEKRAEAKDAWPRIFEEIA